MPMRANARRRRNRTDSATAPATRSCSPKESRRDYNYPTTVPQTREQRFERVFAIDIILCPLCRGQLRLIANVTDPDLIHKILEHINSRSARRLQPRHAKSHQTPPDLLAIS